MMDFLKRFDGSGRVPREGQRRALEWTAEGWNMRATPVQALSKPVGSGKSAVGRAIQLASGGHVIVPSNILMDQVTADYPKANALKGKTHYKCSMGLRCSEWIDVLEQKPCVDCPYVTCKVKAETQPTFFNPMSLYYYLRHRPDFRPSALVVDEAHQLPQMVLQLCATKLRKSEYGFTDRDINEVHLQDWLRKQIGKLSRLSLLYRDGGNYKKSSECVTEMESLSLVYEGLKENAQNFAIWTERGEHRKRPETFLHIKPIRAPQFVMRELLRSERIVLMSGTLLKTDLEDLAAGRAYRYLDLPSPIPKENRPLLYRPTPFPMNTNTDPKQTVAWIESILDEFPNRNTIVHTTYDRAKKLAPHFNRPVLTNTAETKIEALERFKRYGGVFLAAGCAEGLDLRDDLCRLNIIPHLIRPNLGDPVVAKRRSLEDGERWLALEALKTCIQQYGRSTRHERDHSITVVGDPQFSALMGQFGSDVPQYFKESVKWAKS